jgi:hypothetical protein
MSATMATWGGRVKLKQSDMHLVSNIGNYPYQGFHLPQERKHNTWSRILTPKLEKRRSGWLSFPGIDMWRLHWKNTQQWLVKTNGQLYDLPQEHSRASADILDVQIIRSTRSRISTAFAWNVTCYNFWEWRSSVFGHWWCATQVWVYMYCCSQHSICRSWGICE